MSGKNKILKPGELLFKVGEQSDGMYLIRKGQILVYLDKGGTEIPLATIGAGSMLGEMALFDKKPRSASARAVDEVEVTKISNDEFNKIMTQIPKWFVTLMSTLSSRLRDTNERLQDIEAKYKGNLNPIEELIKTAHVLQLLYFKMGVKEVKSWAIEREPAEGEVAQILNKDRAKVTPIIDAIVSGGLVTITKNSYKKDMLTIHNRGDLERFIDFSSRIRKKNTAMKFLPQEFVDILDLLTRQAKATAYDTFSIDLKMLEEEGKKKGFVVDKWAECALLLADVDDAIIVTKSKDINFKIQKKLVEVVLQHARILRAISRSEEKKQSGKAA
ncbi:MAG: Crp/Fnr family transcriptional regulator [Pseudobdellovibrionaceae bacterium]|nr:Crp/Fnr family transcriptional regulator [Pseudobdellovibrionaceae bacterium]